MIIQEEFYYEALKAACEERWKSFADSLFTSVPNFIVYQFNQFVKNPLCLGITSVLMAIAGFIFLRSLIASLKH